MMRINGNGCGAPPSAEHIATFTSYDDARRAMDYLAARGLTGEQIALMTNDVRLFEQPTAPSGYGDAALDGAAAGATTGALLIFVLGLLALIVPPVSRFSVALWGLVVGAAIGALAGLLTHAVGGRHRAGAVVRRVYAGRYDLIAVPAAAERARDVLRTFSWHA